MRLIKSQNWFVRLAELMSRVEGELSLPASLPVDAGTSQADWFAAQAQQLCDAFDARNGNDSMSRRCDELRARLTA